MDDRQQVQTALDLYFRAINENDVELVPLADDVEMSGPMMPEPVKGEGAVRQYLADIAPFVARMEQKFTVIEGDTAAVILEFEGLKGRVIDGAEFFRVRDGKIYYDRVFFDTRPLFRDVD